MFKTNRIGTAWRKIRLLSDTQLTHYERIDYYFNSLSVTYTSCSDTFSIVTYATHYTFLLIIYYLNWCFWILIWIMIPYQLEHPQAFTFSFMLSSWSVKKKRNTNRWLTQTNFTLQKRDKEVEGVRAHTLPVTEAPMRHDNLLSCDQFLMLLHPWKQAASGTNTMLDCLKPPSPLSTLLFYRPVTDSSRDTLT